jgi:hypothetical protein
MGVWALMRYGVKYVLSTNRIESWNAILKRRLIKHGGYREEEVIEGSSEIVRRRLLRVSRAQHGVGEKELLREHLRTLYKLNDDNNDELFDLDTEHLEKARDILEVYTYYINIIVIYNLIYTYT